MNEIGAFIAGLIPSLIASGAAYYIQRAQKKRDSREEEREQARREEVRLQLDLQLATAKLAYATAMALKRGKPNGEVEEGIAAYKEALDEFQEFEREQLSKL